MGFYEDNMVTLTKITYPKSEIIRKRQCFAAMPTLEEQPSAVTPVDSEAVTEKMTPRVFALRKKAGKLWSASRAK